VNFLEQLQYWATVLSILGEPLLKFGVPILALVVGLVTKAKSDRAEVMSAVLNAAGDTVLWMAKNGLSFTNKDDIQKGLEIGFGYIMNRIPAKVEAQGLNEADIKQMIHAQLGKIAPIPSVNTVLNVLPGVVEETK